MAGFRSDSAFIYGRMLDSPAIRTSLRTLWALCDEGGRAVASAGAGPPAARSSPNSCRLGGAALAPARAVLPPWAERRCIELMHARLSEDIKP